MMAPPLVVDLFCGAGGFSLGFHAAGCRILAAADADGTATQTFRQNFGLLQADHTPRVFGNEEGDLERADLDAIIGTDQPDVVIGGPPCQAFSRLGRAKLNSLTDEGFKGDPRNILYRRFLTAVERWQPRAVVMENVPGMLSVGGVNYADVVCTELAAIGYRTGYALLNAVWYGVPQLRERLFFIGIRKDLDVQPVAPPTTFSAVLPEGYSQPLRTVQMSLPFGGDRDLGQLPVQAAPEESPAVTVREALDDLPALTDHLTDGRRLRGNFRREMSYRAPPHSRYAALMRAWPGFRPVTGVPDHVIRRTPRDYETFRRMTPGDRFPEAVAITRAIRDEELARLEAIGDAPDPGTQEWDEFEERFVPPYDEHDFPDKWRKLIPDRPSWTVPAHLAKDSYSHIHYDGTQARMISIREAARLQSFPDAFAFSGNMGDCFRQIGNAVPPLMAWAIAYGLLQALGHEANQPPQQRSETVKPDDLLRANHSLPEGGSHAPERGTAESH
jgi:DNA (cytosine-5)-methyltransferase 1